MPAACLPPTEQERLEALWSYQVLDTLGEASFDDIAGLAARLTGSPYALVSLVDAKRQWFKAAHGLDMAQTHRDASFCAHAILTPSEALVVPDATSDHRFFDNPLVAGFPRLRSYLGIPLIGTDGHALGTLCVLDDKPRHYDDDAVTTMRSLAQTVVANLELRRALRRMTGMALTDTLTGLPNRRALIDALTAAMDQEQPVALVAIDLDHFKEANDAYGHAAGDALLQAAAARLRRATRQVDVVGRLGGDEFVALLVGMGTEKEALLAAERLRRGLNQPVVLGDRTLRLGATLGVAMAPADAQSPVDLLRAADEALIRAKRRGRGSIGRANRDDTLRVRRDVSVLEALKTALESGAPELSAHLQPIVCATGGRVHAVEALARWSTPRLGHIPPEEMFAIASRVGLAAPLSRHLRAAALGAYARLRAAGMEIGRLALNLSAAELLCDDIVDALEEQVAEAGLDLGAITIEITEDALLDRVAHKTLMRLTQLRGLGARLGLDDFGTGTSGLAQLLRLPLDEIKLDRTFTRGLGLDGRAERVVEGTIRLAHSMEIAVVAEGVEEEAQARLLGDMGCEMLQGWLFGPAMPEEELRGWLTRRRVEQPCVIPPIRARVASMS